MTNPATPKMTPKENMNSKNPGVASWRLRPIPITINTITTQFPDHPLFTSTKTIMKVDRVRFSIEKKNQKPLQSLLGPKRAAVKRKPNNSSFYFIHEYLFNGRIVRLVNSDLNPFWFSLVLDDPTKEDEIALRNIFEQLPGEKIILSEIELALDLYPSDKKDLSALKRHILSYLTLPRAHAGARPHSKEALGIDATWYLGSQRGGPRSCKVYEKVLEDNSEVLRIEWTIHGRLENYGIDPRNFTCLENLKFEKLLQWRRVDLDRAAEIAHRRMTGRPVNRKDPWKGVILAHYRNQIRAELCPEEGPDHVDVLGQLMGRFKKLDWVRPQDRAKVFPKVEQ